MHNGTKQKRAPKKVPLGTRVSFRIGLSRFRATVIEDRGNIGVRGRRIVGIRVDAASKDEEPRVFEMPLEELSVLKKRSRQGAP